MTHAMVLPSPDIAALAAQAFADAQQRSTHTVDELGAKALLRSFGIATPRGLQLHGEGDIAAAWATLTPPLVLKLMSPDVLHKSDVGGVALHLSDADVVRQSMQAMRQRSDSAGLRVDGFLLEEMAGYGHELVIGAFHDASFGPVVMCGLGGVFVEILRDIAFRICPITRRDAMDMLADLKAAPILAGARNGMVANSGAVVDALLAVGGSNGLMTRFAADISEVDINPLIVTSQGAVAVDARLVVRARRNDA